jgi:hypothetical protein
MFELTNSPQQRSINELIEFYRTLYPDAEIKFIQNQKILEIITIPKEDSKEIWNESIKSKSYVENDEYHYPSTDKLYWDKEVVIYWQWDKFGNLRRDRLEIYRNGKKTLQILIFFTINKNKIELFLKRKEWKVYVKDIETGTVTLLEDFGRTYEFPEEYWHGIEEMIGRLPLKQH